MFWIQDHVTRLRLRFEVMRRDGGQCHERIGGRHHGGVVRDAAVIDCVRVDPFIPEFGKGFDEN